MIRNMTHFARALRVAGLTAGTGSVTDAIGAVAAVDASEQAEFYDTLRVCFTARPAYRAIFDQAFRLYWRDPRYLEHMS